MLVIQRVKVLGVNQTSVFQNALRIKNYSHSRLLEFLELKCILRLKELTGSIKFDNGANYGFQFNLIAVIAKTAIAIIEIPASHLT